MTYNIFCHAGGGLIFIKSKIQMFARFLIMGAMVIVMAMFAACGRMGADDETSYEEPPETVDASCEQDEFLEEPAGPIEPMEPVDPEPDGAARTRITIAGNEYDLDVTHVDVSGMGLTNADIEPLKYLTDVMVLSLGNNQITDISVLEDLVSLRHLILSFNQITDIAPLKFLTSITWLELTGNPINDSDIAALRAALPNTAIMD
jgi:hypothetical protein